MADTTVRYPGPHDAVEVWIPEDDRAFDEPRHQIVEAGGTLTVSAELAAGLVESGFEPVGKAKGQKGGDDE
jgi:hypothetical protein